MQERSQRLASRLRAMVPPEWIEGLGVLAAICGRFMLIPLSLCTLGIGLMSMKANGDYRALTAALLAALAMLGARVGISRLFVALPGRTVGADSGMSPREALLAAAGIELTGLVFFLAKLGTAIQNSAWMEIWTGLAIWAGCDTMAYHLSTQYADEPPPGARMPAATSPRSNPGPTRRFARTATLAATAFRAAPIAFGIGVTLQTIALLTGLMLPIAGGRTDLIQSWQTMYHAMGFTCLPFLAYLPHFLMRCASERASRFSS